MEDFLMALRILLFAAIISGVAASASAQIPDPLPFPEPGFNQGGPFFERAIFPGPPEQLITAVQQALGLTETQVSALRALLNLRAETVRNLFQELGEKQRVLHELLAQTNPSALDVGNAFLAVQGVQSQLRASGDKFQTDFLALLTPDQRSTIEGLRTALSQIEALRRLGVFGNDAGSQFILPMPGGVGGVGVGGGIIKDRIFGPMPVPGPADRVIIGPRGR
jgi:hypothetical protein